MKKELIKNIACFLSGALIFGSAGAFALTYMAEPASFKVLVNGKEFTSEPPVLVVDGKTYLPLRAIGDALGVSVNWNTQLNQAEVGNSAPVATSGEYSRNNPAPINTVQIINIDNYSEKYSVAIRVMEIIRGQDAISARRDKSVVDEVAKEGYELMMVKVAVSLLSVDGDKAVDINYYDFKPYTSNNEETERGYLHMDEKYGFNWLNNKMYTGGNTDGWMIIQVKKDDVSPKIVYGQDYDGTGGVWFKLY